MISYLALQEMGGRQQKLKHVSSHTRAGHRRGSGSHLVQAELSPHLVGWDTALQECATACALLSRWSGAWAWPQFPAAALGPPAPA